MKKVLILSITLVLVAGVLVGCSNRETQAATPTITVTQVSQATDVYGGNERLMLELACDVAEAAAVAEFNPQTALSFLADYAYWHNTRDIERVLDKGYSKYLNWVFAEVTSEPATIEMSDLDPRGDQYEFTIQTRSALSAESIDGGITVRAHSSGLNVGDVVILADIAWNEEGTIMYPSHLVTANYIGARISNDSYNLL